MSYQETQRKIVYDLLKDFEGGKRTDDSKVSERHVEEKLHQVRSFVIRKYFTSNKVRKKEVSETWLQTYEAEYSEDDQYEDETFTVFKVPEIMWLPNNAGLFYVGSASGIDPIPTTINIGDINIWQTHHDTSCDVMAHLMGNELRVFGLQRPEKIMVRGIYELPPQVHIYNKGYGKNKEDLELENFKTEHYYPLSGHLLSEAKQMVKQELQMPYQIPVDRSVDDRHTVATQEQSE